MGHPIVMGRKTYESLPKVLPGIKNIVIITNEIKNDEIETYKSIKVFLEKYKETDEDVFIIGGASIYSQFIDLAINLYLTEIEKKIIKLMFIFPNSINKTLIEVFC